MFIDEITYANLRIDIIIFLLCFLSRNSHIPNYLPYEQNGLSRQTLKNNF